MPKLPLLPRRGLEAARAEHDLDHRRQRDQREDPEHDMGEDLLAAVDHVRAARSAIRLMPSDSAKITAARQRPTAAALPTSPVWNARW